MMGRLVPSIMGWLVIVIVLALAPTIETYNGYVTGNVAAATNATYMLGMTAIDDFAGFLMIIGLLVAGGLFAVGTVKAKDTTVGDMLGVIGSVIIAVIALAMFSGSIIGYINALITAGTGFAKTAYGILPIMIYLGIISGATAFIATKAVKKYKRKGSSVASFR